MSFILFKPFFIIKTWHLSYTNFNFSYFFPICSGKRTSSVAIFRIRPPKPWNSLGNIECLLSILPDDNIEDTVVHLLVGVQ